MCKIFSRLLFLSFFFSCGCTMFGAWRTIPPPGGCDQCHTVSITNNWKVAYHAPTLTDERDRDYFQTEAYNMPDTSKPTSVLELSKVEELRCFECHKSPNAAHKGRKGRFHH
ncbi:lipoprotein cytochrome c, 2 heme-binding sites [Geotalea daltonii FRC-32]|uniref:Lipoprotein cytochrome c, 2 heme-binding sites n=1 Tax=Geotalea daltonii (strain DSM 22248 / JCM 15807 / FRC-32) TaxID=316067 RepID=B9M7P9_GEODF|nr:MULTISPECIES: hypothetical protein [Geotalea]ACM22155.1 lipoprotein cytochrome c, 2 heme-binding sites [Geotalea daltonii FRC-32]